METINDCRRIQEMAFPCKIKNTKLFHDGIKTDIFMVDCDGAQIKTNNLHHNKINRNIENNTKDKE